MQLKILADKPFSSIYRWDRYLYQGRVAFSSARLKTAAFPLGLFCKTGYSVFIEAESEEDPIEVVKREKLYEEEEDLKNIRAVTEISKEQYEEVMKLMELMKE